MRNLCILVISLGVVAAGGCSHRNMSSSVVDVPVVSNKAGQKIVPPFAFSQLSDGRLSVVGQTKHRVFSISDGLTDVRIISRNPIVAVAEQDGWFFFATSVGTDATIHQPTQFISGYAIRHGGRQIVSWSTW